MNHMHALFLAATATAAMAVPAPGGITMTSERVASGLARPVQCAAPPGDTDRLFIVEQRSGSTGRIRILNLNTGAVNGTPFLSQSVSTGSEQGLLGLAFHPRLCQQRLLLHQLHQHQRQLRSSSALAFRVTQMLPTRARACRSCLSRSRTPITTVDGLDSVLWMACCTSVLVTAAALATRAIVHKTSVGRNSARCSASMLIHCPTATPRITPSLA